MEIEGSLPHSRQPATCPYPKSDGSCPCSHPTSQRYILILSSHPHLGLSNGLLPSGFPTKTLYAPLLSLYALHILCSWFDHPNDVWLSSSLRSLLHSPVTLSLLGPNILLSNLFSKTLSLHSSLWVSDQVTHSYKTTGKIIVLYILTVTLLDRKLEDKRFCTKW